MSARADRWAGQRGSGVLTASAALASTALGAVTSVIIARELGVVARGQFAVISSLALLVGTTLTLGLPTAASYAGARLKGDDLTRVVHAALWATAVLAALAACAYAVASLVVRPSGVPRAVVLVGAGTAVAVILLQVSRQVALTTAPLRWFAASQVIPAALLLGGVALVAGNLTVASTLALSALASLTGAVVAIIALARHGVLGRPLLVRSPGQCVRALRPYLGFALLTYGTISLTYLVQRVDVLLVEGYRGSGAAGIYAVAVQVSDLLLVVPAALGYLVFRLGARSSVGHWAATLRTVRWTVGLSVVLAIAAGALATPLVERVFGASYSAAVTPLRLLLPGAALLALQSVISNYIAARGRPRRVLFAWLAGAVVGIGLDVVVIPIYGVAGAAAASSISYLVVLVLHLEALRAVRAAESAGLSSTPGKGS